MPGFQDSRKDSKTKSIFVMKKAGTIFICLSLAVLILWLVPWLYNLATLETYSSPFTLYSPVGFQLY